MRDFCKFSPKFWQSELAIELKSLGIEAHFLAHYLQTNHHSNMLGAYHLPIAYIAHDTGINYTDLPALLRSLHEINFCQYDFKREYVWVIDLAFMQVGEELKPGDKRLIALQKQFNELPNLEFTSALFAHYQNAFGFTHREEDTTEEVAFPFEGASMDLESKYKKKEKYKQKDKEKNNTSVALPRPCEEDKSIIQIFNHWKEAMNHPQAQLDSKRKSLIQQALKWGYSLEQLCDAITGCSLTPHNIGQNDRNQRYDGLHIILRNADQIDRFIRNCYQPPKQSGNTSLYEQNLEAARFWLEEDGETPCAVN